MELIVKSDISLKSTKDVIQSETILSVISFDENKKRTQTIYYKDIKTLNVNDIIYISKNSFPYLGFILVKYSKIDKKYYQYPLVTIDTTQDSELVKYIYLPNDLIKKVPFGSLWKKSLKYEDFTNSLIYIENEPIYLNTEDLYLIITDNGDKILID